MRRCNSRFPASTLCALAAVGFLTCGVVASTHAAGLLWLDPPAPRVPAGDSITVTVRLDDVVDVYGADWEIGFPQTDLSVVDDTVAPGSCPQPDFVIRNSVSGGVITYGASQLAPTPPCSGGPMATIELLCPADLEQDVDSPLNFIQSIVADPDGIAIDHATQGATITCEASLPLLRVENTGGGTGTVTSDPAGIDCGSDCSQAYSEGVDVSLTAVRGPGSTFEGWGGDCFGTLTVAWVTMDGDKTCRADFAACVALKDVSGLDVADAQYFEACAVLQAGNFRVLGAGGNAVFVAGEQIVLQAGFEVQRGGVFSAYVDHELNL